MRIDGGNIQSAELAQWLQIFMAQSSQRIQNVAKERDQLDVRSGIFSDLRGKLGQLVRVARDLAGAGSQSAFGAKSTTLSQSSFLTAIAAPGSVPGNHAIHVQQLARAHAIISNSYASTDKDLSTLMPGTSSFSVQVGGTTHDVLVQIDPQATNADVLTAVASAINAVAGETVRAAAIRNTDTTSRLSITSRETGTANKMTLVDNDGLLAALGLVNAAAATDTSGGWINADLGNHELDAKLTVDGIGIIRGTNSIQDVLSGVTLNLLGAQAVTDPDIALTIAVDKTAIRAKVDKFLELYNETFTYLDSKVKVDRTTFARGDLAGEYAYTSLWQQLRVNIAGPVSTTGSTSLYSLSQVGITAGSSGTFSVTDASKLEAALDSDLDTVEALFNSEDGVAARLERLLESYTKAGGVISSSAESLTSKRKFMNDKIDRLESLQDLERERLIAQYGALQEALKSQESMMAMLSALNSAISS